MGEIAKANTAANPTKMDLAAAVSERVDIQHIRLVETLAKRKQFPGKHPERLNFDISVTTNVDEAGLRVIVEPRFAVVGSFSDEKVNDEALRIEALFVATYTVQSLEGLTQENFRAFGELNGVYNVWPYWREYVQSITTRMGFPPLTLPVLHPVRTKPKPPEARSFEDPVGSSDKGTAVAGQ